jgi:hypothetical protein
MKTLNKLAAIFSLLFFLGMVTVNALANILPFNGMNTGELSDALPNLFVPAGITFSIWGLIYLLLAAYVIFALIETFGSRRGIGWEWKDGLLFSMNAAANAAWIFAWHWKLVPLSLLLTLCILVTLVILERRLLPRLAPGGTLSPMGLRSFCLSVPIRVYLGWALVATIANATALLVSLNWNGFGLDPRFWTVLVILAGLSLALVYVKTDRAYALGLVVVWAYAGIVIKRVSIDPAASLPVWLCAGLSALAIIAFSLAQAIGGAKKA